MRSALLFVTSGLAVLTCTLVGGTTLQAISESSSHTAADDPFARLPWTIDAPEEMEFVSHEPGVIEFGAAAEPDGTREARATARHVLDIDFCPGESPEVRVARTAREYEQKLGVPPRESRPARIHGHAAWEIYANVPAPEGGMRFRYHVIIASAAYDATLTGEARADGEGKWLPRFRSSAASWRTKP